MCRVIMVSKADFREYDSRYGALELMCHLEKECGGHGNGYALIRDGKIIETRKGEKLANEEIYGRVSAMRWDYLVYHTRINSMGGRGDANCHPFVRDNDCLAMNGTEYSLRAVSDAFNRTDTECIFRNMTGLGLEQTTRALVEFGSVFVGCSGGKPFVVKAGGTLHKWGETFHASTFPADVENVKDLPVGYIWEDGRENLQFVRHPSYDSHSYGYTRSLWDDYSWEKPTKSNKPVAVVETETATATKKAGKRKGSQQTSYELGYSNGYATGYEEGYEAGYTDCKMYEGADDEYSSAFTEGYCMGYNDASAGRPMDIDPCGAAALMGKKTDPSSDYNIGFADGRDAGYDEGYEAGYSNHARCGINLLGQED